MQQPTRYKLETNITIVKETFRGPIKANGTFDENEGYWESHNGFSERLTVTENSNLGTMDFMGVMNVLGKMHEAIKGIKKNDL